MWAIIGGTKLENIFSYSNTQELSRDTPFGETSSGLICFHYQGQKCIFLPRHGKNHELLPSEINFKANIFALKKYGVSKILSLSAVGSLQQKYKPGDVVIPNQYINLTHSSRNHTFCGKGIVGHVSLAEPVTEALIDEIIQYESLLDFKIHSRCTYICIEGPYYSTRAESLCWHNSGYDVIGMTNFPEYALAREAGICYLPITFVTDYDSWDSSRQPVILGMVLTNQQKNRNQINKLIEIIFSKLAYVLPQGCSALGLTKNLMCDIHSLTTEQQQWLAVLNTVS